MKVYKNPFVSYPCYFVRTGTGHSAKGEAQKSTGYCVELHDGEWMCSKGEYYNFTIKNDMVLVAESRESIRKIIDQAVIDAVLKLTKERKDPMFMNPLDGGIKHFQDY